MKYFIITGLILIIACLAAEKRIAAGHRRALKHVIHVNGTRGKSSVSRLIAAGLAEGGHKVFCKTTGTLPMIIDSEGNESEIKRLGRPNISEQIRVLGKAAKSGAQILVAECMAVDPELQYVCEHKILRSDIGVITNARVDHVAEMGETEIEVCEALCNTIPEGGIVFTSEKDCFSQIEKRAASLGSKAVLTDEAAAEAGEFLFPDNIALALAVCESLGVDKKTALAGMKKVKEDPYAAEGITLCKGALFVNAMSANDPESTRRILETFSRGRHFDRTVVILNCRPDRAYRTGLMADFVIKTAPQEVWIMGRSGLAIRRRLKKAGIKTLFFKNARSLPLESAGENELLFAAGNIADEGIKLMEIVRGKEEQRCTRK